MAASDQYGLFWNSQSGDRIYDANSFEKWLSRFFTTGVFKGDLAVTTGGGMNVIVATGYVNINGKVKLFEQQTTLAIEQSSPVSPRIDTVVIERNNDARMIELKVVTGTPSVNPIALSPIRTASIYQLVIAQVRVNAMTSVITDSDITDTRDNANLCGAITNTLNNFLYGTEELIANTSDLATGTFYFQYE